MKIFMDAIDPREKTIGFRATQLHALAEQHLRDFQDNEKTIPTVLTTSQKPSTGVDARNVRHIVLMRSINSMIEFKQIIGRGTFRDPEWDGEPVEPQPRVLTTHGNPPPAEGERAPANRGRGEAASKDQGAPAPAHDGQLVLERPRAADAGRAVPEVAVPRVSRAERAAAAKAATGAEFTDKQNAFMGFVLAQYLAQGVDELDAEKLSPLLKLKYRNAIADAFAELGRPDQVRRVFVGFQRHLYAAQGQRE